MITIPLDNTDLKPFYIQIYEYIRKEILNGNIAAEEKLPSARNLAANLNVSRSTVDTAYDQLVAEGYLDARPRQGYFANHVTHLKQIPTSAPQKENTEKNTKEAPPVHFDFNPDSIDLEHFPYSIWKSIGKNQLDLPSNFSAGDAKGDLPLRQAIANYLRGSRGVICRPEQIIIGAGLSNLLQMLCILFSRETIFAMEDPGYLSARQVLSTNGYSILDIPLKENTMDVLALAKTNADICYVTPSHQFPLGSVMPVSTRQKLLHWAEKEENRYILEDDHDSEFRYKGKPIPALQSLDKAGKVIYIGTFSKAISPAIRTGYMVLPMALLPRFERLIDNYSCPVSRIEQAILTDFIKQGYFEKHLNRMRKIYKGKHDCMMEQLQKYFPEKILEISGDNAGLYVLIRYLGPQTEEEILRRAQTLGMPLKSLKGYYQNLPFHYLPTFLLGFANLSEETIPDAIRSLSEKVFASPKSYLL